MGPLTAQQKKQKEKDKKRKEKELAAIKEEHAAYDATNNGEAKRAAEREAVDVVLATLQMKLVDVPADGNCLFHSIGVSLNPAKSASSIRAAVVDTITRHAADFAPFIEGGEEGLKEHVAVVQQDGQWGSSIDIRAAAMALSCPIRVVTAAGVQCFGEDNGNEHMEKCVTIVHFEKMFELGEHFCGTKLL